MAFFRRTVRGTAPVIPAKLNMVGRPVHFAQVERRVRNEQPGMTPGIANVRPAERVFPQQPYDTPRQGDTPARAARMPVPVMSYPVGVFGSNMGAEDFALARFGPSPHAALPYGVQDPLALRANLGRSPAIAYGSMFTIQPQPYGYG